MKLHLVTSTLLVLASVVPVAAGRNNLRRGHLNNLAAFEEEVVDIVSFASACYLPHFLLLATTSGSGKVTTFFARYVFPAIRTVELTHIIPCHNLTTPLTTYPPNSPNVVSTAKRQRRGNACRSAAKRTTARSLTMPAASPAVPSAARVTIRTSSSRHVTSSACATRRRSGIVSASVRRETDLTAMATAQTTISPSPSRPCASRIAVKIAVSGNPNPRKTRLRLLLRPS